jgi:hypothetical protein
VGQGRGLRRACWSILVQKAATYGRVAAVDSITTAVTTLDGVTRPRIAVSWAAATDAYVTQYQTQVQAVGASTWLDAGMTDGGGRYLA